MIIHICTLPIVTAERYPSSVIKCEASATCDNVQDQESYRYCRLEIKHCPFIKQYDLVKPVLPINTSADNPEQIVSMITL